MFCQWRCALGCHIQAYTQPLQGSDTLGAEAEAETRDELSREKLRYVRPGDIITPLKRASYFDNEDEDQGELFPVDADDDAYDWDEAEDDGIAPRVVRDIKTPNGTRDGGT